MRYERLESHALAFFMALFTNCREEVFSETHHTADNRDGEEMYNPATGTGRCVYRLLNASLDLPFS